MELLSHPYAALTHAREKGSVTHALEDVQRDTGDQRPAAESGRMIAWPNTGGDILAEQHRSHRQAAGERLRERQEIGFHVVPLIREQMPGAAEPALHLIED